MQLQRWALASALFLMTSGTSGAAVPRREIQVSTGPIVAVRFTPDGNGLIAASSIGNLGVWDTHSGARLQQLSRAMDSTMRGKHIADMDVSQDGGVIAVAFWQDDLPNRSGTGGAEYSIGLIDAKDGGLKRTLAGHVGPVNALALGPAGTRLTSVSSDRSARFWDLDTGRQLFSVSLAERCRTLSLAPNGKLFVMAVEPPTFLAPPEPKIEVREADTGILVQSIPRRRRDVSDLAFAPDGRFIAIASNDSRGAEVAIWDLSAQEFVQTYVDDDTSITKVAFSLDGTLLAAGGMRRHGGVVVVRNLKAVGRTRIIKVAAGVSALRFSPNGTQLALGTVQGHVVLQANLLD